MAKRTQKLHQKHIPNFVSVVVIVTGLVITVAIAGYLFQVSQKAGEVASAKIYVPPK